MAFRPENLKEHAKDVGEPGYFDEAMYMLHGGDVIIVNGAYTSFAQYIVTSNIPDCRIETRRIMCSE